MVDSKNPLLTAHIFEALLPYCSTRLLWGDEYQEQQLIKEMVEEHRQGRIRTCILYPTKDSQSLSEWCASVRSASRNVNQKHDGANTTENENIDSQQSKIRFIALDGTYSCAARLYKHLDRCLRTALEGSTSSLPLVPVVKLDLGEGGIRSAIAGIMQQPAAEKICTFQALVLALKQLGESSHICALLLKDLDKWLEFILASGIKMTKTQNTVNKKMPRNLEENQREPAEFVQKFMAKNQERHEAGLIKGQETEKRKAYAKLKYAAKAQAAEQKATPVSFNTCCYFAKPLSESSTQDDNTEDSHQCSIQ